MITTALRGALPSRATAPMREAHFSPEGARIELAGVEKRFGERAVLRGIDLTIEPGSFVAIVGRSGCGKSTLLRLLTGIEQPSAGSIAVGAGPNGAGARMMFQDARLLPWARVRANVEVGLGDGTERAEARRRALEALARVALQEHAEDWPSTLSGGQRQRVALARALASRPRLLALDEPLGALDALTRIEMQTLITEVWSAQRFTAVLVTHDVTEAVALADRVLLLEEGRITLDLAVDLPRPRWKHPRAAEIESRILERLLGTR
jgi:sulfonate transport system ATP-binding protein